MATQARPSPQQNPIRPIYFIASYPRSGNTWVRSFLYMLLQDSGYLKTSEPGLKEIDAYLPWDIAGEFVHVVTGKKASEISAEELAKYRTDIHEYIARHFPGPPLIKTHALFGQFLGHPTINLQFMKGGVYLVRNPLDVASSLAKHLDIEIDMAIKAMGNHSYVVPPHEEDAPEPWGSWSLNVYSWTRLAPKEVMVLRHEDLMADPERYFGQLSQHIGFRTPPDRLRATIEKVRLETLQSMERQGQFRNPSKKSKQFFGGGVTKSYQEKLTPEQAKAIILAHAVQMKQFGYLTEDVLNYAGVGEKEALASSAIANTFITNNAKRAVLPRRPMVRRPMKGQAR